MEHKKLFKNRLKALLPAFLSMSAVFVYILIVKRLGFGIPCLFHRITGFKCPGCGITTLCTSLLRFDIRAAFKANPFVFVTLPFIGGELIFAELCLLTGKKNPGFNQVLLTIYIVLLIIWGIARNAYPFLKASGFVSDLL